MNYPNYEDSYPINFSGTKREEYETNKAYDAQQHRVAAVESIDDQIARLEERRARALEKLRLRSLFGEDVYRDGFVIFFQKRFPHSSGTLYSYAAVKAGGSWWTTGARNKGGVSWEGLLDFIIDQGETFNVKFASKWDNFPIIDVEPTRATDSDRDGDLQANTKE